MAAITSIRLPPACADLACVLAAWSRRGVGWELSRWIDTDLTLAALEQALADRRPAPGLIHHADRGVPYASAASVARLTAAGAKISLSAVGNPSDNATADSFFKTLKREEGDLNHYQTIQEAEANLGRFIADVDNAKRLHASLGYRPPSEAEANSLATVRS